MIAPAVDSTNAWGRQGQSCLLWTGVVGNQMIFLRGLEYCVMGTRGRRSGLHAGRSRPAVISRNSRRKFSFLFGLLRFASHSCTRRDSILVSPSPTAAGPPPHRLQPCAPRRGAQGPDGGGNKRDPSPGPEICQKCQDFFVAGP